jgi:hypothetical protein
MPFSNCSKAVILNLLPAMRCLNCLSDSTRILAFVESPSDGPQDFTEIAIGRLRLEVSFGFVAQVEKTPTDKATSSSNGEGRDFIDGTILFQKKNNANIVVGVIFFVIRSKPE